MKEFRNDSLKKFQNSEGIPEKSCDKITGEISEGRNPEREPGRNP